MSVRKNWIHFFGGLLAAGLLNAGQASEVLRGSKLFAGDEPLTGSIVGHKEPMPPIAVRCSNCHQATITPGAPSIAPALNRAALLSPQRRRGGPPSVYEEQTFCRILRTGVDPAYVLIAVEMPRYEISDAQCRSLWLYLTDSSSHTNTRRTKE